METRLTLNGIEAELRTANVLKAYDIVLNHGSMFDLDIYASKEDILNAVRGVLESAENL